MPYCPTCNGRFQDGTFCPKDGTALLPDGTPSKSLVGQIIGGRYRLTKLLGEGGMGEVYAAEHIHITKKVAVKLLHPEINSNPEALIRFRQEAQSASSIGHDNIVTIDDFGTMDDNRVYLCMEFLQGESLAEAMQAPGGIGIARTLNIMIQVCDGLSAAHSKGIIHRDMKPENVFLTRRSDDSELVKILDFGIAKVKGTDQNESLTRTGTVFGTPHYMSPEQALGQKLDHRADIYSVGVMLFEIFTGQVPFKAESFMGILSQHITKPPPIPSTVNPTRSIPKPIEEIILKAMAKEPDQRFSNMQAMRDALKLVQDTMLESNTGAKSAVKTLAFGSQAAAMALNGMDLQATISDTQIAEADMPLLQAAAASYNAAAQAAKAAPPLSSSASNAGDAAYQATMASVPPPNNSVEDSAIPKTILAPTGPQDKVMPMATPLPMPGSTPVPTQEAKAKNQRGLLIGIVVGAILLIGGGASAFFLLNKSHKSPTPPPPSSANNPGDQIGAAEKQPVQDAAMTSDEQVAVAAVTGAVTGQDTDQKLPSPNNKTGKAGQRLAIKKAGESQTATNDNTSAKPEPKPEPTPKTPDPDPKQAQGKVPKPLDKPVPPVPKPVEPKPEPNVECCKVRVVSMPPDAAVFRDGRPIGRTPLVLKLDPGESVHLKLAKGGFKDRTYTFTANDNGTEKIRLTRQSFGGGDSDDSASEDGLSE